MKTLRLIRAFYDLIARVERWHEQWLSILDRSWQDDQMVAPEEHRDEMRWSPQR